MDLSEGVSSDDAVRATNDDAANCKRGAVQLGYWADPFIQFFVKKGERKAPEINRGYYARTQTIRILIDKLVKITDGNCQIISLGAGFDTLYWRLNAEHIPFKSFVEVDFPTVTSKKCYYIKRSKALLQGIATEDGEVRISTWDMHSPKYHLVAADLRNSLEVEAKLRESEIDYNLPTVFIAECVLVYMDVSHSSNLLSLIAHRFPTVLFINYEQVNMGDKFGQVMVENLRKRSCDLAGVEACQDLRSQEARFVSTGFESAKVFDMVDVYKCLPKEDVARAEAIEMLDERELMIQLFQHYCICLACKDAQRLGLADIDIDQLSEQ